MESPTVQSSLRADGPPLAAGGDVHPVLALGTSRRWITNPNHHLWLNNGTWFLAYTIYPTPFTKERIRSSLGTQCVVTARLLRDEFFANFPRWAKSGAAPSHSLIAPEDAPV